MIINCESIVKYADPNDPCPFGDDRCSNDKCYCNALIYGDKLYLQWDFLQTPNAQQGWNDGINPYDFDLNILSPDNVVLYGTMTDFATDYGVGRTDQGKYYQWAVIDTSIFQYSGVTEFIVDLISMVGGTENHWYSKLYCFIKCSEETLLISAEYNQYDDAGFIYQLFPAPVAPPPPIASQFSYLQSNNSFQLQLRLIADIIQSAWSTDVQLSNSGATLSSKRVPVYTFRTPPVPAYIAEILSRLFAGNNIIIKKYVGNNLTETYSVEAVSEINKDFDEGLSWIVSLTLKGKSTIINFSCN